MRTVIRKSLLAAAFLLAASAATPASALYLEGRDLYPKRFNPDGSMDCARWCGLLESCC